MWNERKEFVIMREKILTFIEKNSRIDLKELAIILGVDAGYWETFKTARTCFSDIGNKEYERANH